MSKQDGGQAFPMDKALQSSGMTLRDYFASRAIAALVGSSKHGGWSVGPTGSDNAWLASASYALADAMLAERNQERT